MENRQDVFILDQKFSTQEYQDLISSFHLLIGMRLHALVFAAINDVPFMAISYDPKVDRFVDGMKGTVVNTIGRITAEELTAMAENSGIPMGNRAGNRSVPSGKKPEPI